MLASETKMIWGRGGLILQISRQKNWKPHIKIYIKKNRFTNDLSALWWSQLTPRLLDAAYESNRKTTWRSIYNERCTSVLPLLSLAFCQILISLWSSMFHNSTASKIQQVGMQAAFCATVTSNVCIRLKSDSSSGTFSHKLILSARISRKLRHPPFATAHTGEQRV